MNEILDTKPTEMTQESMHRFADTCQKLANEGIKNPLGLLQAIDYGTKMLAEAKFRIRGLANEEANKYAKGDRSFNGIPFEIRENVGVTYNYSHCAAWVEAKAKLDDIQNQMKLKEKGGKLLVADDSTGEIIPAAVKKGGGGIAISFKYPEK